MLKVKKCLATGLVRLLALTSVGAFIGMLACFVLGIYSKDPAYFMITSSLGVVVLVLKEPLFRTIDLTYALDYQTLSLEELAKEVEICFTKASEAPTRSKQDLYMHKRAIAWKILRKRLEQEGVPNA